jgi:hypothetical protein
LRSLRCFFLAILLRRFLMTEPTAPPSAILDWTGNRHPSPPARHQGAGHSPGKEYRRPPPATASRPSPPRSARLRRGTSVAGHGSHHTGFQGSSPGQYRAATPKLAKGASSPDRLVPRLPLAVVKDSTRRHPSDTD